MNSSELKRLQVLRVYPPQGVPIQDFLEREGQVVTAGCAVLEEPEPEQGFVVLTSVGWNEPTAIVCKDEALLKNIVWHYAWAGVGKELKIYQIPKHVLASCLEKVLAA